MSKYPNARDSRRLLWHGSRGCNFGGIFTQGLRIAPPEAPPNGKAFGNGVYLADRSSKSAAYCDPWTSDQVSLLLLCGVQMGEELYVKTGHEYYAATQMKAKGLIGTKMLEHPDHEPKKWTDAGGINYDLKGVLMPDHAVKLLPLRGNANEYIVYDIAQVKLKYVFMLKWAKVQQWCIG